MVDEIKTKRCDYLRRLKAWKSSRNSTDSHPLQPGSSQVDVCVSCNIGTQTSPDMAKSTLSVDINRFRNTLPLLSEYLRV